MRVFVYEYMCATGGGDHLRAEGWAMLRALVQDLAKLPGVGAVTMLAEDGPDDMPAECVRVRPGREETCFPRLAAGADWCLVIAPEFDDILLRRCTWAREVGRPLNCSHDAIALTADKLRLAAHLTARGIATPDTMPLHACPPPGPVVCKPRFGAGAQATFSASARHKVATIISQAEETMPGGEFVLQPYVAGTPGGVAFLVGPGGAVPLLEARQRLSLKVGQICYEGGELPLPAALATRATSLAQRAVAAVPGLFGYVGVDLVLGNEADFVIEINPRLTTSYVGLRRLARFNVAGEMLRIAEGGRPAPLQWRDGRVAFAKNGNVREL